MIRNLIQRFYPSKQRRKISFLGINSPGKTTLLYQLKLHQVVQTIPTIGFNIEDVDFARLNMTCWDLGTGCGHLHMLSLIKMMVEGSDGVLYLVDSTAEYELAENVEVLGNILGVIPLDVPVLVYVAPYFAFPTLPLISNSLATKKDLSNSVSLDTIRTKFAGVLKRRPSFVIGASLIQDIATNTDIKEGFDWLHLMLESAPSDRASLPPTTIETRNEKLESWLTRLDTDSSPDEFLSQFREIKLPAWDHYTHIRIAYLLLVAHGRQKGDSSFLSLTRQPNSCTGKDMIFSGISKYISESSQTRGRTFHVTMTYFWVQMVHFGIRSMGEADSFERFLLLNPYVMNTNLWADYYSRDVMMSPKGKESMVLPDKKPLPNLVVQDVVDRLKMDGTSS
uniref:Putative ADP-ribosylation factor n=1 Tax=Moniliophthora roreri TaxID=221103 RepID=A0A0W0G4S6_MONRR